MIESYAGIEKTDRGANRRTFIWIEGDEIRMGNTEAFVLHLAEKFELILTTAKAADVHSLLRVLGERVLPVQEGKRRGATASGTFRQPEPEDWVIGKAPAEKGDEPTE